MAFWVSFFFIFIFLQRRHTFLYELGAFFYLSLLPSFFDASCFSFSISLR